jgi:hypothetical protein
MSTQVLAQNSLIDEILYFVYEDCRKYGKDLFCLRTKPTCEHASTLAACAFVSRQWASLAIRHLWGRYGTYDLLMKLVSQPEKGLTNGQSDYVGGSSFVARYATH